tara:strand:+ start:7400 stop:7633 length:234 start_codon:yes stop_codon:yes gene_type:complete
MLNNSNMGVVIGAVVLVVIALVLMPTIISSIDATLTAITASSNSYNGTGDLLVIVPIVFVTSILGIAGFSVYKASKK